MTPKQDPIRRKRTHSDVDSNTFSSPTTSARTSLPAIKKRRLDNKSQSPSTAPSTVRKIKPTLNLLPLAPGSARQNGTKTFIHEVPDSDGEDGVAQAKLNAMNLPFKTKQLVGDQSTSQTSRSKSSSVYDVPDSGDELELPAVFNSKMRDSATKPRKTGQVNGRSVPTKSPKKNGTFSSKLSEAHKGSGRKLSKPDKEQETEESADEIAMNNTPSKNRFLQMTTQTLADRMKGISSVQRSGTGLLSGSPQVSSPKLKGILTPRHRKVGRPRKNVAFNSDGKGKIGEVFFEDIDPKAKTPRAESSSKDSKSRGGARSITRGERDGTQVQKRKPGRPKKIVDNTKILVNSQANVDEDDEVCVICNKPDSAPPNEILFCEGCDKAVHQKCYDVPIIPDDDWFCRECTQDDAVTTTHTLPGSATGKPAVKPPDIHDLDVHLQNMKRVLLDRCCGNRRLKLKNQDEAYDKTFQLVEQTVAAGEGNSMTIIGARGSGKTTLIETVLTELAPEHNDSFHVVRLSGFIHTDDKLALKETWRQLGKEMDLEEDLVNKTKNYADTMASLLALLSHPAEITGDDNGVISRSVVFIIDEFDLFAAHPRQTLLYNLFDIAQARKAPIAVIGLTTRIDVVESLEKRVKSRFSHRYVHLSLPKSIPEFWGACRQGLIVDDEDLEQEGLDPSAEGFGEFHNYWNKKIEGLRQTLAFQDFLEYHFYSTKSVSAFLTACIMPLAALSASQLTLELTAQSSNAHSLEGPDSKADLLSALSDLELALLIAAARLDIIAHTDTLNFAMAYDEYSTQIGKQRVQSGSSSTLALGGGARLWGRGVAGMAWERLVTLGLLVPAGLGGRSHAAHGGLEGKMWRLEVTLEEIPYAVELPTFLGKWCTQL